MKITILGANGKTGQELVKQAVAAGHEVIGLVKEKPADEQKGVTYMIGDATITQDVVDASDKSDAVVSVLGTSSNKTSLMSDAVKAVVDASKKTGVKRFVVMSSFAVNEDSLSFGPKLISGMMKGMMNDKAQSEESLRKSDLDWTIVHATMLNNKPLGSGARVLPKNEKVTMKHKIARSEVAAWILSELGANSHVKQSITISAQ